MVALFLGKAKRHKLAALAALCLLVALPGRPVEGLLLEPKQGAVRALCVPLGRSVVTSYIHSVERTPVEDWYRISSGFLHEWRTRTRSHNAGLPVDAGERGRFVYDKPWLVLEGSGAALTEIFLRVGDETFGRNTLTVEGEDLLELYKDYPGMRLRLSVVRRSFLLFY